MKGERKESLTKGPTREAIQHELKFPHYETDTAKVLKLMKVVIYR